MIQNILCKLDEMKTVNQYRRYSTLNDMADRGLGYVVTGQKDPRENLAMASNNNQAIDP